MIEYSVVEDNGGGLYLFLFHDGDNDPVPTAVYGGWEYQADGTLNRALQLLDAGGDDAGWESGFGDYTLDPAELWDELTGQPYGHRIIAYSVDGEKARFPERMGAAGKQQMGIVV